MQLVHQDAPKGRITLMMALLNNLSVCNTAGNNIGLTVSFLLDSMWPGYIHLDDLILNFEPQWSLCFQQMVPFWGKSTLTFPFIIQFSLSVTFWHTCWVVLKWCNKSPSNSSIWNNWGNADVSLPSFLLTLFPQDPTVSFHALLLYQSSHSFSKTPFDSSFFNLSKPSNHSHSPNPPLHKGGRGGGGMRFFKNGCNGGMGNFC